jgi:hypothetical protein
MMVVLVLVVVLTGIQVVVWQEKMEDMVLLRLQTL